VIPCRTACGERRPAEKWATMVRGPTRQCRGEGIQAGRVGSDSVDWVGVIGPTQEGIKVFDFS
jgi:hypothetical protein